MLPHPLIFHKMIIDSKPLGTPLTTVTIHLLQGDVDEDEDEDVDEENTAFSNQVLQIKLDVL